MGVEVSHDDVVITEVKRKLKVWCEIGRTAGYKRDVHFINVDGDIVYGGYNGEVLSDGVIEEEGIEGDVDKGDGVMN